MLVVKIGGAANVDMDTVCADLARLWHDGQRMVVVHGGSDETNSLAERLGHAPRFVTSVSGHTSRLTDRRTLEIFMMATALVNSKLVEQLQAQGVQAVGLSGVDGRLIEATRKDAIRVIENGRQRIIRDDWTGTPERANTSLLAGLLDAGYLPVIAPLGVSPAGEALNIDGDRAAALLAGALRADTLVLLTNVPGLLRQFPDEATLIPNLLAHELDAVMGSAQGRMRKKLLGADEALQAGVRRVVIADGRVLQPLQAALEGRGTVIETERIYSCAAER